MQLQLVHVLNRLFDILLKRGLRLLRPILPAARFRQLQCRFYSHMGIRINGTPRFIGLTARFDTSAKIEIQAGVVISEGVIVLTHDYSIVNAQISATGSSPGLPFVGDVIICRNSFVGLNAIIMPGTHIGVNVIVAAGSVVTGIIKDGLVVAGVPARPIGTTAQLAERSLLPVANKRIRLPNRNAHFVSLG